ELHLLVGLRRARVELVLWNGLPPLGDLIERLPARLSMPHEIATYGHTSPPDAAPAMDIDFSPLCQGIVNRIEGRGHWRCARQPAIQDGMALIIDLACVDAGLFL